MTKHFANDKLKDANTQYELSKPMFVPNLKILVAVLPK